MRRFIEWLLGIRQKSVAYQVTDEQDRERAERERERSERERAAARRVEALGRFANSVRERHRDGTIPRK